MSYYLNIWSHRRVKSEQPEIKIGEYTITIEESVAVEEEDVPTEVLLSYADIKYLTSLYMQPYTTEKTIIDKAMRYAKMIAKEFDGVVENPQLENSVTLVNKRKTFSRVTSESEIVSICWYMDCRESLSDKIGDFIELLERYLPPALPRRYGSYEPPEFKYAERGNPIIIGEPYSTLCHSLPHENEIEAGLYYFENDIQKDKLPQKLISYNKLFVSKDFDRTFFFADKIKYAKVFPFARGE